MVSSEVPNIIIYINEVIPSLEKHKWSHMQGNMLYCMNLIIIPCNKATEMSETQQLISKVICNFFHMTGSEGQRV